MQMLRKALPILLMICFIICYVISSSTIIPVAIGIILSAWLMLNSRKNKTVENTDELKAQIEQEKKQSKAKANEIEKLAYELEETKKQNRRSSDFVVKVQETTSVQALGDRIINEVCSELVCSQGLFFICEQKEELDILKMISGYAYSPPPKEKPKGENGEDTEIVEQDDPITFEFGEGLTGEAAANKKVVHLENIPEGHLQIVSGLGASSKGSLLILPIVSGDKCIAVMELATFSGFSEHDIAFLTALMQNISAKMDSLTR